jgi:hypothetical protein
VKPRKWNRAQVAWMRRVARGRVTVRTIHAGPETGFALRYRPRVAGHFVSLVDTPPDGYLTSAEALSAGQTYKQQCETELEGLKNAK